VSSLYHSSTPCDDDCLLLDVVSPLLTPLPLPLSLSLISLMAMLLLLLLPLLLAVLPPPGPPNLLLPWWLEEASREAVAIWSGRAA